MYMSEIKRSEMKTDLNPSSQDQTYLLEGGGILEDKTSSIITLPAVPDFISMC